MDAIKKKMEKLSNETSEAEVKKMMLPRTVMRMSLNWWFVMMIRMVVMFTIVKIVKTIHFIRLRFSPQSLLPISNLTFLFQIRIAHFEDIKAANEAEAEKFEEQLRNIQKKMQVITIITIHHH